MKTWQMIKELTENTNKKFTYNGGKTYVILEDDMIVWKGEHQRGQEFAIGYIGEREREWEEVKTPVTFMEDYNNDKFDYRKMYIKLISMYADKEDELTRLECEILALKREIESLEKFNHLIINAVDEARDVMLGE